MPGFLPRVAFCLIVSLVCGCSTESEAIFRSFNAAVFQDSAVDSAPLNPNYRYLRVTANGGRIALLVLGYIDKSTDGPVEVWYSGERETLRLRNGRVVSAAGMPTEWRNVILPPLPDWPVLVRSNSPVVWSRLRDVMPGYRMSVRDTVTLQPSRPPRDTELKGVDPSDLAWFEERTGAREGLDLEWLQGTFVPENALPAARYGISVNAGAATVVYGEQCLDWDFCFAWQRWPAARVTR